MSSHAGTVFPSDHPRFPSTKPSVMLSNFKDGKRWSLPMPEFPSEVGSNVANPSSASSTATNGDMSAILENLQSKKSAMAAAMMNRQTSSSSSSSSATFSSSTTASTATATNIMASSSSNELKHAASTASSAAQLMSTSHSATTSTSCSSQRVSSKRSQVMTHSMSASEMNMKQAESAAAVAFATTAAEPRAFGRSISMGGVGSGLKLAGGPQRVFSVDRGDSRLPIAEELSIPEEMNSALVPVVGGGGVGGGGSAGMMAAAGAVASSMAAAAAAAAAASSSSSSEMKFEQKQMSASSMKVTSADGFSAEKIEATNQGLKRFQTGDISIEEKHRAAAVKEKLETKGMSAEKTAAVMEEQRQMKSGDVTQQEQRRAAAASMKVATENYTAEKMAMAKQAERQTISSHGVTHQETHMAAATSSKLTFTSSASQSATVMSSQMGALMSSADYPDWKQPGGGVDLDDLDAMSAATDSNEVMKAVDKYSSVLCRFVDRLKADSVCEEETKCRLGTINDMFRKAWAVPYHGNTMGYSLCDALRTNGGLDLLIDNCSSSSDGVQFCSASVLEQCLVTENRDYVVKNGLEQVVKVAQRCSLRKSSREHMRVGTGILEHLFKHSEGTCSTVIRMGGLEAILEECRESDVETLQHCASALANLSLYGGSDNQQAMIKSDVPVWLFPLAFHHDDNIKYYACLALAALVANKEIEAAVLRSGTLNLVEPFLVSHNPAEFARSSVSHVHGQSKDWLQHLVPVLNSKRKEARSLAAFHFAMEAGIKKKQGISKIFHEIGAIEPLKIVASSPNAIASKYAAQALRLIGEEVPHKLSQQVPLWSVEDVIEWLKQIGFSNCTAAFTSSRVDGDLLLQLTEKMLVDDIGLINGILRRRFMRELVNLKKMTDYSSCDSTNLNIFLQSIGLEMCQYTYPLLQAGVEQRSLRYLTDEQLARDCSVENSIHRLRLLEAIRGTSGVCSNNENAVVSKDQDAFISYRRSNGSQLASLLKVHLQLKGFEVFIDVDRLEAGKFDNNLLQSIRKSKHFILILTPNALDRCVGDMETKDWVHREVVTALQSQCNIIPITDNFQWPEPEQLPEDMRAVCTFNGVRWIHDYQEACVDKIERFMKGDTKGTDTFLGRYANVGGGPGTPGTPNTGGRSAPGFQRSQSNESKGSMNSDRDVKEIPLGSSSPSIIHSNGIVTLVE